MTLHLGDDNSDNDNCDKDYGDQPSRNAGTALKKLGNLMKKPYNKMAARDVFVQGKLVLSQKLYTEQQFALNKQRQKCDLLLDAKI
jgi:hypothetical protein